jgi:hypothetical protein
LAGSSESAYFQSVRLRTASAAWRSEQVLGELEDGHQGQPPGRCGGWAADGEGVRERLVVADGADSSRMRINRLPLDRRLVTSVAVDSDDRVCVFRRRPAPAMLVFDRDGTRLGSWGEGRFREPHGVWIGPDDAAYVAEGDRRIGVLSRGDLYVSEVLGDDRLQKYARR